MSPLEIITSPAFLRALGLCISLYLGIRFGYALGDHP